MLEVGIKAKNEIIVTEELSAAAMGSGTLLVYATPAMIALMEHTAYQSVEKELEDGFGTVGTGIEIKHVSATPIGMKVRCESELIEVDGRRLVFSLKVYDEKCLVGEGRHERVIINNQKFLDKVNHK